MKVWIDMTASAHPLVFRPLVALLRERGDDVEITARDYAQTLQLIEQHGMSATVIGHHGGRSRLGKGRQMRARLHGLRRWARKRNFDLALAHEPRAIALVQLERSGVGERTEPPLADQLLVDAAEPSAVRRVDGDAERRGLAVHRPAG